jgi:hypothetical protein
MLARLRFFCVIIGLILIAASLIAWPRPVKADLPLAAQLLAQPYTSTGVRVNVSNLGSNMRGLATDGTTVYVLNGSGNVVSVPLTSVDMTPAQATQDIAGTVHTVGWGSGGAPSMPSLSTLSLAYSHGCLFITNNNNTEGSIEL